MFPLSGLFSEEDWPFQKAMAGWKNEPPNLVLLFCLLCFIYLFLIDVLDYITSYSYYISPHDILLIAKKL